MITRLRWGHPLQRVCQVMTPTLRMSSRCGMAPALTRIIGCFFRSFTQDYMNKSPPPPDKNGAGDDPGNCIA